MITNDAIHANEPWRNHPRRACKGRPEYADLTLVKPLPNYPRKEQLEDLAGACLNCPVFRQCRIDLLSSVKTYKHFGIQAGIIGST